MQRPLAAALVALALAPGPARAAAPSVAASTAPASAAPEPKPTPALVRARALYFSGDALDAARAFESAIKTAAKDASAWRDGAIVEAEAGRPEKAVDWSRRAAALAPSAEASSALGWALLRAARPDDAAAAFADALARDPADGLAALGAGRARLALGRPADALPFLRKAESSPLQQTLADFYLGRAEEALGDSAASAEGYRRAIAGDAYFHEGRVPLGGAYLKLKRYDDAWKQVKRLAEAEPSLRVTRALTDRARSAFTPPPEKRAPELAIVPAPASASETAAKIPLIRVGIGTSALGRPRARASVTVRGSGAWRATDPETGRALADCPPQQSWTVRIVPPVRKGKKKSRARLEIRGPDGEAFAVPGDAVLLNPVDPAHAALQLEDDPERSGAFALGRALRGTIEVSLYNDRRSLRLVDIVDLEDYTQGVVGAEMPSRSPLEALKSQAVLARTHALFIKNVWQRHKKEGYDVCDGEHCQAYGGLHSETERTRAAVAQTRARVALYKGKLAHVIYSANCGGITQSGRDVGWGKVPYWTSVSDSERPIAPPDSPSALRGFLGSWPDAYCKPAGDVHGAHSRWARVISAKDLEEKLNRKFRLGRLRGLRVLRRDRVGHVESLLLLGSQRDVRLEDEYDVRGLLGVGSLRSTLFVVDTEYRREGKPKGKTPLIPDAFVFRGGGWGHAVGFCQSGAIGRAEAGQDYETIVKAYFTGVELSNLEY